MKYDIKDKTKHPTAITVLGTHFTFKMVITGMGNAFKMLLESWYLNLFSLGFFFYSLAFPTSPSSFPLLDIANQKGS